MNVIRDIGESLGNAVLENVGRAMGRAQERSSLPVDLLESGDEYLAVFDAPGVDASDVQVQYRDGAVEVRVDRFRGFHEGFEMRYPGRGLSLDGRVELPDDARVDAGAASATLEENGTLAVRVPKRDDASASAGDEASEAADGETDAEEWSEIDEEGDESDGESDDASADPDSEPDGGETGDADVSDADETDDGDPSDGEE